MPFQLGASHPGGRRHAGALASPADVIPALRDTARQAVPELLDA
jgi:hypothetical protein